MKVSRIKDVKMPTRGTSASAGIDFYTPNSMLTTELLAGESALIPSGIKARLPQGYALIAFNKSGVATKQGLQVGACVVDEDYQGEIHLHVTNVGTEATTIEPGQKLVQMVLVPVSYEGVVEVPEADLYKVEEPETPEMPRYIQSERGEGGFGSTGLE